MYKKDLQYYRFCLYGLLKNLRFFEPYFILFLRSKHITFTQIGILYAIREITTNLLEIPSGLVADTIGRRISLIFSYVIYILSFLLFAFGHSFLLFAFAIFLYGIADAFRSGTNKAMIYQYLEAKGWAEYKVNYYGHTRSCSQFGSALSAILASVIVFITGNYQIVYLFTILPYILGLMLIMSYPKWLDGKIKSKKVRKSFKEVTQSFLKSLKSWLTVKALLNLSLLEAYHKAVKDYIQPVIKQLAMGITIGFLIKFSDIQRITILIGFIYFIIYSLTAIASRYSYLLINYFHKKALIINGLLTTVFIIGSLIGFSINLKFFSLAILLFMLIYIIHNLRKPLAVEHLNLYFDTKVFASAVSTQNQLKTILTALISIIIGWLIDKTGLGTGIIIVSLMFLIISLFLTVKEN